MPSAKLYGRRWHFSTDIVVVPAALSAAFHAAWIVALPVAATASGAWPGACASEEGRSYKALLIGYLAAFGLNLLIDLLLVGHSLRGAPFELSKRRWVEPLLYAATLPLGAGLSLTAWGTHVSTRMQPDCWPVSQRDAVTNVSQALVFSTWGFMAVAVLGIALTYNAYPTHRDLSSWEARCECVAATLCCHQNVVRRPDGRRPPLTNIAELTAGLLSHTDLDASDITAALLLASAAQNRRRRLRIARALLPVYRAIRSSAAGSASATEEHERGSASGGEEGGGDAWDSASTASSLHDVPADRELDRMIAEQEAERCRQQQQQQQQQQHGAPQTPPQQQPAPPPGLAKGAGRRGKVVSWAADRLEPVAKAVAAATREPAPRPGDGAAARQGPPDLSGISLPPPALRAAEQQQAEAEMAPDGKAAGGAGGAGGGVEHAGSLPLTEETLALLDGPAGRAGPIAAGGAEGEEGEAAAMQAEAAAEGLLAQLPEALPDQEAADHLAVAIEEEIRQLGGSGGLPDELQAAALAKEESLDLSAVQVDPEAPSIWFPTASSQAGTEPASHGAGSRHGLGRLSEGGEGAEEEPGGSQEAAAEGAAEEGGGEGADLMEASPFFSASGGGGCTGEASSDAGPAAAAAAAAAAAEPEEVIPPADDAAAAAVAEVAAAAAAAGAASSRGGASSAAGGSSASRPLEVHRQLTARYPVVLTPSEHVHKIGGPLPAAALADIYAGRHERVPAQVLQEALHYLKFADAVYALEPKIEAPSSLLDLVVFRGLGELEELDDDASIELLHLNCSNRVLAHLPYLLALDHGRRAVVLAIRGTISAADIVTDAIVYPEPLDDWLPPDMRQELREPAFAHAGMVAAARHIFTDMREREVLQQLTSEQDAAEYAAPEEQQASRGGSSRDGVARPSSQSQYDADSGSSSPRAERYRLPPAPGGGPAGSRGRSAVASRHSGSGSSTANRQSPTRSGPAGRLWEGCSASAAQRDSDAPCPAPGAVQEADEAPQLEGFHHHSMAQQRGSAAKPPSLAADGNGFRGGEPGEGGEGPVSPGRQVGEIMRRKIDGEGWQLIVCGHSLGAGAAALVSLKLRESFPGLKCIAYSCPGGLMSRVLSEAVAPFTTTVVVGKDAVPRATVGNMARLVDEMVTALSRCRQPKMKAPQVLFMPWWKRSKERFAELFYGYDEIPPEALQMLHRYYESRRALQGRSRLGQPLPMFPPGRCIFVRPLKSRACREWEGVWVSPRDIIAEGLLISPKMYRDHLCSTAYEALSAAAERAGELETGPPPSVHLTVDARPGRPDGVVPAAHKAAAARRERERLRRQEEWRRARASRRRAAQRLAAQRSGSLQEVLIAAP